VNHQRIFLICLFAAAFAVLAYPALADTGNQIVLYQNSFATDPHWTTNNPASDYWDPAQQMYHFGMEPSTGNYAYSPPINFDSGSFSLQYDIIIQQMDQGATFRMGFTGSDMDFNKGPNVITAFTNSKYGMIMILHSVTQSAIQSEVTSDISSYGGPTVTYQLNTTYHVEADYNNDTNVVTETVTNKQTNQQLWSYFTPTQSALKGMNRVYLGNVGDYGTMGLFAVGWIDNVQLTASAPATPVTPTPTPFVTQPTYAINQTAEVTKTIAYTPIPTSTKKSSLPELIPLSALGLVGIIAIIRAANKNN